MSVPTSLFFAACVLSITVPACASEGIVPQAPGELPTQPSPAGQEVADPGGESSTTPTSQPAPDSVPAPSPASSPAPSLPTMAEATPPAELSAPTPSVGALSYSSTPVTQIPPGWQTLAVEDWATVYAPADWSIEAIEGGASFYLADDYGEPQVSFSYDRTGGAAFPPSCNEAELAEPSFAVLESTPIGEIMGEELQHSLFVKEVIVYNYEKEAPETKYQVNSNISEVDRTVGTKCPPLPAVYPDAGGYFWVALQGDPIESLYFDSMEEATEYVNTEEYQTIKTIIESIQLTL